MKKILVLSVLSFASLNTLAQLPTIRAEGGGGKNVNWPLIKKQSDPEGPGIVTKKSTEYVHPPYLLGKGKRLTALKM